MNSWRFGPGAPATPASSVLAFLTVDEEEYARVFRENGYGENFIAQELELLRKLKEEHKELLTPLTTDEEASDGDLDLAAALERSRQRRAKPLPGAES